MKTGGDERKALIVADLLGDVNSAIDGSGRISPWLEAKSAVLGDALIEYGYPTLSNDFREWLDIYAAGDRFQSMPRWGAIQKRVQIASRELAHGDHLIVDPNSSGQGFAPSHVDSPFHKTLLENDFRYSHSSRVWHPYYGARGITDVRRGPEHSLWHTYRSGNRVVGNGADSNGDIIWNAGFIDGGRMTRGTRVEGLRKYLQGARRRQPRKR